MMKTKKSNYKFWHSPIALAILLMFLSWFGYKIFFLIEKQKETTHKKEVYLDEIERLEEKKNLLSDQLIKLDTEEGIEEIIRSKYPFTKSGEKMVTIVEEKNKDKVQQLEDNQNHGLWNFIRNIFK